MRSAVERVRLPRVSRREPETDADSVQQGRRDNKADGVAQARCTQRQLRAMRVPMEDREGTDERNGRHRRQGDPERHGRTEHQHRERDAKLDEGQGDRR